MDVDFDFSDDKIKSFLLTKLEEIRLNNEGLESVLKQRKQVLNVTDEDDLFMDETNVRLEPESWKKMFNNKYAVGFTVENYHRASLEKCKVYLKWDSKEPFTYKVEVFCETIKVDEHDGAQCRLVTDSIEKTVDNITSKGYIVVVFNSPQFLDKIEYEISGNFVCIQAEKEINLSLPSVKISCIDHTSHTLNDWNITKTDLMNIFTLISCNEPTKMVMILPDEWSSSLDNTLEINCSLTKVNIDIHCKNYYVSYKVSQSFDNSLISVHSSNKNTYFLKVYTKCNDQLFALLHHLHCTIPSVTIFPQVYYKYHLWRNASFSNELLMEFRESIGKEIECSYKFLKGNSSENNEDFRRKLSQIEGDTDNLYLKICNMKY